MIIEFIIYLITGAFVGLFAGLFGIGGGLILVPVLSTVFFYYQPSEHSIHLAIGTSLATILITSLSSAWAHHTHQAIRWDIVKTLSVGLLIGGFMGGWSSQYFHQQSLAIVFGVMEIFVAIYLYLNIKPKPSRLLPGKPKQIFAGTIIGNVSSILGIGGGTLNTPYMIFHNVPTTKAIATSTVCSLPIAFAGSIGFLLGGLTASGLPNFTSGFIYWPAFFGIVITSIFIAPMGAKLTHKLPVIHLKKLFALLLMALGLKMLFI